MMPFRTTPAAFMRSRMWLIVYLLWLRTIHRALHLRLRARLHMRLLR
jgi:hypothetical protein